jgi:putative transposase
MSIWKLRPAGVTDNHKRIRRIYPQAGLGVRRRGRKRLARPGIENPSTTQQDENWAMDFVCDTPAEGQLSRSPSLVDAFIREAPAIAVDFSLPASRVIGLCETVWRARRLPLRITIYNGLEFQSRARDA